MLLLTMLLPSLFAHAAPPDNAARGLSLEEKIERVTRLKEAKRTHNIAALLSLYHPDVVLEQPSLGVRTEGLAALRPGLVAFAKHFPDYNRAFEGFAESGNTLIAWGKATLTLTGVFNGRVPNGEQVQVMTFVLFEFEDGNIVYEGHFWDLAAIARQSSIAAETVYDYAKGGQP